MASYRKEVEVDGTMSQEKGDPNQGIPMVGNVLCGECRYQLVDRRGEML